MENRWYIISEKMTVTINPAIIPQKAPCLLALGHINIPTIDGNDCAIKPYPINNIYTRLAGCIIEIGATINNIIGKINSLVHFPASTSLHLSKGCKTSLL